MALREAAGAPARETVAVIGAGIVGVSTAIWLQRDGHDVVLVDRAGPGEATSHGNAGMLASCSVVPVTVPGLIGKVPGMVLDPDSPLFLRWSYLPRMIPWLVRYLARCRPAETARIAAALHLVTGDSLDEHRRLAAGTPAEKWIAPSDYVFAYRDRAAFAADAFGWNLRKTAGYSWQELDAAAFRAYDPGFGGAIGFAVTVGGHGHIKDPGAYVKDLARHFEEQGGTVRRAEVLDFVEEGGRLRALATTEGPIACSRAVVAAGAWSKRLTARLGLDVPLESERGYHIELYDPSVMPRAPTSVVAGKFVATPMDGRLRCAGIVEFGGLDAGPSEKPFRLLLKRITEAMPGLTWSRLERWMGHRPATADSIPLIGELSRRPGIYAAFGHHHIGLTGGPKTGRMIADLIAGRRPNADLAAFRPDRFAR
jgi:D-amino-acid dehydrogenase